MPVTTTDVVARDIHFPPSENLDGSDPGGVPASFGGGVVLLSESMKTRPPPVVAVPHGDTQLHDLLASSNYLYFHFK